MDRPEPTRISVLTWACLLALGACRDADLTSVAQAAPRASSKLLAQSAPPAAAVARAPSRATTSPSASPALAPPASPASESPIQSVLVLGDSLSDEKVGGGGFVRILRQRCASVVFDNRAKGGFMVNQIRKRLETEVLREGRRYSHAIVFGGVNDLYSDQTAKRTLPRIEGDLSQIHAALKARGIAVIAITVTPWGGFKRWFTPERGQNTLTLNRWLVEQGEQGAVQTTLDAYPLLSCGDPERLCPELAAPHKDGLHFGKLGHEKLAQALLDGPFSACAR
jgi:lysophospholipase L1-like esterase